MKDGNEVPFSHPDKSISSTYSRKQSTAYNDELGLYYNYHNTRGVDEQTQRERERPPAPPRQSSYYSTLLAAFEGTEGRFLLYTANT